MSSFFLFLHIAGLIIGLGAVTVIDIHGFLGRKSTYWTLATTRTHKVTKPLIWLGMILTSMSAIGIYEPPTRMYALALSALLIANGTFLSFVVSPFMLQREQNKQESDLLPASWQRRITISFIISFIGWWSLVGLLVSTIAAL